MFAAKATLVIFIKKNVFPFPSNEIPDYAEGGKSPAAPLCAASSVRDSNQGSARPYPSRHGISLFFFPFCFENVFLLFIGSAGASNLTLSAQL